VTQRTLYLWLENGYRNDWKGHANKRMFDNCIWRRSTRICFSRFSFLLKKFCAFSYTLASSIPLSNLLTFIQGTVSIFKSYYTLHNFCSILDVREKCFSVKVCCKSQGIADRLVTTLAYIVRLRFSFIYGCWEKFSPEAFKDFWEFHI